MKFIFCVFIVFAASSMSYGKAVYVNIIENAYEVKATFRCQTCHSSSSLAMNSFGKDFSQLKRKYGQQGMSQVWQDLSLLDSDQDGINNLEELRSNLNPGIPQ